MNSISNIVRHLVSDAVLTINNERKPQRPYLFVNILHLGTKMLYDTGADICCLNESLFKQLEPQATVADTKTSRQFKAAGGHKLQVVGKYEVPMRVGKKTFRHPFFVIRNLTEPAILGIDFIEKHGLTYNPAKRSFKWKSDNETSWDSGTLKVQSCQVIPPLTLMAIKAKVITDDGGQLRHESDGLAQIAVENRPLLRGGPDLVRINEQGIATIMIQNSSPIEITINRDEIVGTIENPQDDELRQLNPDFISSLARHQPTTTPLSPEKKKFILEKMNLDVPPEYRDRFVQLMLKHHEVFSATKYDLGRAKTLMHEIALKTEEPVYIKQFKIPDAHREEVEKHVAEWLKLGVIQPTRSKFNCPIFVVAKKNGGLRIVQDFRGLNDNTMVDKYSMKDVSECIGEIGRSNSTIFSTLDLTAGFWQMLLHPKSRPYTAFTLPGKGQFQWVTSPMGLLGCPASFQRLMETVVKDIENVIVYIDDLLAHSTSYEEHLHLIDQIFLRLREHGLKVNLEKCFFGAKQVAYLGFHLTEEGIKPGTDKLKTVAAAQPPTSVHEIRQFLGLCNFFRTHVRNFAQISAPLTALTRKDSAWKSGPLPEDARKAFRELQSCLCSEPVVDYPRRNRPYALITDAALGDDKHPGGLGAILSQVDEKGEYKVIAYASRKLQTHEKNYTPFLLEMQAAIWGMEHFSTYLRGRHFTLFTDHKPLEKLGKVHTRTLNRLQEAMNSYDFEIVYKKGSEMPADFLSRHAINAISWESTHIKDEQNRDPFITALKQFLLNRELPKDPKCQQLVRHFSPNCFIEDDLLWVRIKRYQMPSRVVLFLPTTMIHSAISEAHGQFLTGHDGAFKTKERLLQCYYWPGMDRDITEHIKACHRCQLRKNDHRPPPALLTPLPQPTEPNMRIHADLHGPLRTSGNMKKYILVITDAFTKYVELVAIENKEAVTVTEGIFKKWICRYGVPLEIITDQGKEFCNKLSDELYKLLGTRHNTTTSRHPACNAQVEVCNKTIAKYLASFVDDSTLDWEQYLAPLMFSYNTSFHKSILNSPYFLTYGIDPRLPNFPAPDLKRKFYGESTSAELHQAMLYARDLARRNNENASDNYRDYHNRKAASHNYKVGQLVLLDEHSFLHKNAKLAPKWTGPHRVVQVKNETNVELLLKNNKRLIIHVNRLKPYIVSAPENPNKTDEKEPIHGTPNPEENFGDKEKETIETETEETEMDYLPRPLSRTRTRTQSPPHTLSRTHTPVPRENSPQRASSPTPAHTHTEMQIPKRGRGRPRKLPRAPSPARARSPAHTHTQLPEPAKRPRGRPRKNPQPTFDARAPSPAPEIPQDEIFEPLDAQPNPAADLQDEFLRAISSSTPQKAGGIYDELTHVRALQNDGWTLVSHKKKWNRAQNRNYANTGDVYNEPPFKEYTSHQGHYPAEIYLLPDVHHEQNIPPDQHPENSDSDNPNQTTSDSDSSVSEEEAEPVRQGQQAQDQPQPRNIPVLHPTQRAPADAGAIPRRLRHHRSPSPANPAAGQRDHIFGHPTTQRTPARDHQPRETRTRRLETPTFGSLAQAFYNRALSADPTARPQPDSHPSTPHRQQYRDRAASAGPDSPSVRGHIDSRDDTTGITRAGSNEHPTIAQPDQRPRPSISGQPGEYRQPAGAGLRLAQPLIRPARFVHRPPLPARPILRPAQSLLGQFEEFVFGPLGQQQQFPTRRVTRQESARTGIPPEPPLEQHRKPRKGT